MRKHTLIAAAAAAALPLAAAPASAAPPSNDPFESPTPTSGAITGQFGEATTQPGEPSEHGAQSLWYAFRPATSGRYALQPASGSSGAGALAAVYTGDSLAALQRAGEPDRGIARIPFVATAGTTYRIAVHASYAESTDRFALRVVPAPLPANDDFAAAQAVKVPGRYQGSLVDATDELGEPRHGGARPQRSLWYRFRAKRTGKLSIQAGSSECRPSVTVYTGSQITSLRRRAGAVGRTLRFQAQRGRTYRLAVDCGYRSLEGFELTISDGSIAGKGLTIEPVAGQTVASVRERGLRTVVKAKRKTTVGVELLLGPGTASELGLERRVIGRVRGTLGYRQQLPATIRLTGAARDALEDRTSLSAVLRVTLLNTNAPDRVLTVPVELPN